MYCTVADLTARFGADEITALTDREHTGAINTAVADIAITDASTTIDSYLTGRYRLPLATLPTVLVQLCANIARYKLYDNSVPETVRNNYQDAIRFLEQLSRGQVTLGLDSNQQQTATDSHIEIQSAGTVWGRKQSKGFI